MYRLLCIFILSLIVLSGCCKKYHVTPGINILYPKLNGFITFKHAIIFSSDSMGSGKELLFFDNEDYRYHISTEPNLIHIIDVCQTSQDSLVADTLLYSDSISNVHYEYVGYCNNDLVNFYFIHNGVVRTRGAILK